MFTDGFVIKWASFLVRWQIFCMCSIFLLLWSSKYRVTQVQMQLNYSEAILFSTTFFWSCVENQTIFPSIPPPKQLLISFLFWRGSTCGAASKQIWDCVERKECKCYRNPGDSVGICLLGNLNVMSPLHQGSFFSSPFPESLTGGSFMAESQYFGALSPGLSDRGCNK